MSKDKPSSDGLLYTQLYCTVDGLLHVNFKQTGMQVIMHEGSLTIYFLSGNQNLRLRNERR
jgi:hypothetical protein